MADCLPLYLITSAISNAVFGVYENWSNIYKLFSSGNILKGIEVLSLAIVKGIVTPTAYLMDCLDKLLTYLPIFGKYFGNADVQGTVNQSISNLSGGLIPATPATPAPSVPTSNNDTKNLVTPIMSQPMSPNTLNDNSDLQTSNNNNSDTLNDIRDSHAEILSQVRVLAKSVTELVDQMKSGKIMTGPVNLDGKLVSKQLAYVGSFNNKSTIG
jgi:hypothetical protein